MLVRDVAAALSAQLVGDGSLPIERIVHPAAAVRPSDLAVAMTGDTLTALAKSKAQLAVISEKSTPPTGLKAVILASPERGSLARLIDSDSSHWLTSVAMTWAVRPVITYRDRPSSRSAGASIVANTGTYGHQRRPSIHSRLVSSTCSGFRCS